MVVETPKEIIMVKSNGQKTTYFEDDVDLYNEFLESYQNNTFTFEGPVYGLIRNTAYLLGRKYNRRDDIEDLAQAALLAMGLGQYNGYCSLRSYVYTIVKNELIKLWKQAGQGKVDELKESLAEAKALFIIEQIWCQISSEKLMRKLLYSDRELQREIARVVLKYEGDRRLSGAEIIRTLAAKGYDRYKVRVEILRLRDTLMESRK